MSFENTADERTRESSTDRRAVLRSIGAGVVLAGGVGVTGLAAGETTTETATEPTATTTESTATPSDEGVVETNVSIVGTGGADPANSATITVEDRTVTIEGTVVVPQEVCLEPSLETTFDGTKLAVIGGGDPAQNCPARPDSVEYVAEITLTTPPEVVHLNYEGVAFERSWPVPAIEGTVPRDIDGDGLREDFNANGKVDFVDVNTFFQNSDTPAVKNNIEAYDFEDDGRITLQDVMALFQMV